MKSTRRHLVGFMVILASGVAVRLTTGTVAVAAAVEPQTTASPTANPAPVNDATLRSEVNAFMDQYWALFSAGQIDQLAERVYHPFGQLSNTGQSSIEQMKSQFPGTRKALLAGGYGRSNMPNRNICILGGTVAIVSGRGIRYLTDGGVMGECGWTYTLIKGATGWRMVSIYSHDPGTFVTCAT